MNGEEVELVNPNVRGGSKTNMKLNSTYLYEWNMGSSTTGYAEVANRDYYSSRYKLQLDFIYSHPTSSSPGYGAAPVKSCSTTNWVDSYVHAYCGGNIGSSYKNDDMFTEAKLVDESDSDGSNYGQLY